MNFADFIVLTCVLLQLADAATTICVLRAGGTEANPIMRWVMDRLGVHAALALKVVLVFGVLAYCYAQSLFVLYPGFAWGLLALCAAVVINNLAVLFKQRACRTPSP